MNTMKLNSIIEQHRPLQAISSLPIVFLDNREEVKVLWFNYYLDQNEDELVIYIRSIFTMGDDMQIEELPTDIQLKTKITEFEEPSLSKKEYLSLLEVQFVHFDYDEMNRLLKQAEMEPLLVAYTTAMNYKA